MGFWTFLTGTLVDIFVVVRNIIIHEPIHNQPLLFVGILFIIFGFQFILIGLLAEMIRYYAFQAGEEYSIGQEVELQNNYALHDGFVPAEINVQNGWLQPTLQPLYSQPSQDQRYQPVQPLWNAHKDMRTPVPGRNTPRRSTMIPL